MSLATVNRKVLPPLPPGEPDVLTPQEREVIGKFREHLLEARRTRVTGQMAFEVNFSQGGIQDKTVVFRIKC